MIPVLRRVLPIGAVAVLVACGPKVLHVDDQSRPTRSPEQVQLFLDAPDRPYRTIALIRSDEANLFRSMDALKRQVQEAAARLGADAVILSLVSGTGTETITTTDSDGDVSVGVASSDEVRVYGRAIVFR